jgi:hypothetical protein
VLAQKQAYDMAANSVCGHVRFWRVTDAMSLEWIAIGFVACLFGLIALMPSFDGKWDV